MCPHYFIVAICKRVLVSRLASIISLIPSPTRDDDTLKPFSRCRPSELSTRSWFRFRRTRESRDCVAVCLRRRVNDETPRDGMGGWTVKTSRHAYRVHPSGKMFPSQLSSPFSAQSSFDVRARRLSNEGRRVTSVLRACSTSLFSLSLSLSFNEILFIRFYSWEGGGRDTCLKISDPFISRISMNEFSYKGIHSNPKILVLLKIQSTIAGLYV